ncbi:MAG: cyanophycin synthetase [Pseudomonadota bacterium]
MALHRSSNGQAPGEISTLPLRVLEHAVYRGPNLFANRPMIRIQIDLGTLEEWPTNRLPGFTDRLLAALPGLLDHGCSFRRPFGLVERLREGTWLGHVIEHVALELQALTGAGTTRGKTRSVFGRKGCYNILFVYEDEGCGVAAGSFAIQLVAALLPEHFRRVEALGRLRQPLLADPLDIPTVLARLRGSYARPPLGPTTRALVDAARKRNIPAVRLDQHSLVQLGQGSRQKRIRASMTGATSFVGVNIAGNKQLTRDLLAQASLPVPKGGVVPTEDEALALARRLGWPVVVKPLDGNHGRGVTIGVADETMLRAAFNVAQRHSRKVIVEQQLAGRDFRILVIAGQVAAVAERRPAHVIGDGQSSIRALVGRENRDPRRGTGHANALTRIVCDAAVLAVLARAGMDLDSVPAAGQAVYLRDTANLSTGGAAIDRTDDIHPANAAVAVQAAAVTGLDVCGIDFLSPDIALPVACTGGGIVEVNAAPGLRMHLAPSEGTARDVAAPVIGALFPRGARARIPILAVTGTNGKSTTVRMVGRILRCAGLNVGMTTTTGLYHNEHLMKRSDASGPRSARSVLANPCVDVAVLETARGGILREGLGFDRCDIGAVLNVTEDHLGLLGIDRLEQLAEVKGVVARAVHRRGAAVLNADDPLCRRITRSVRGQTIWFSLCGGAERPGFIGDHLARGGTAVVLEHEAIVLHRADARTTVTTVAQVPSTLAGAARFNTANALAATAICVGAGIAPERIREGLQAFNSSFEDNPGRLNVHDVHGVKFIVDYAHNPAALRALGGLLHTLRRQHRRVMGMVSIPGDRRDDDIAAMGALAAGLFDEIVFREAPDGRGRATGEVNAMMTASALAAGMDVHCVHRVLDEIDAAEHLLRLARPGDLVVLLPTAIEGVWSRVLGYRPGWTSGLHGQANG